MQEEIEAYIKSEEPFYETKDLINLRRLLHSTWSLYEIKYKNNLNIGKQLFRDKHLN